MFLLSNQKTALFCKVRNKYGSISGRTAHKKWIGKKKGANSQVHRGARSQPHLHTMTQEGCKAAGIWRGKERKPAPRSFKGARCRLLQHTLTQQGHRAAGEKECAVPLPSPALPSYHNNLLLYISNGQYCKPFILIPLRKIRNATFFGFSCITFSKSEGPLNAGCYKYWP